MKNSKSSMGRSRDFGIPSGPGKGDADRTSNWIEFTNRLEEVKFPGVTGFKKVGLKFVKTYGASAKPAPPQERFAETDGEWLDVMGIGPVSPTSDLVRE